MKRSALAGVLLAMAGACTSDPPPYTAKDLAGVYDAKWMIQGRDVEARVVLAADGTFAERIVIEGREYSMNGSWLKTASNRITFRPFRVPFDFPVHPIGPSARRQVGPPPEHESWTGFFLWSGGPEKAIFLDYGMRYAITCWVTPPAVRGQLCDRGVI